MSQLLVRKKGTNDEPRKMTRKSFEMGASRRGWEIVGEVPNEKSEIQKLMDQKRAEKAAQEAARQESTANSPVDSTEVKVPAKRGPKPKNVENEA